MSVDHFRICISTPLKFLVAISDETGLTSFEFSEEEVKQQNEKHPLAIECKKQISAYLNKELKIFDLPIALNGTDFQKSVWTELLKIPFGKTTSYQKIANDLNNPKSIRAVGTANGKNKHAILIPCHRVIGSDGSLTGYAGGLWRKKWLLDFERGSKQMELFG